ncbi:MAG: hypothetical protein WCI23_11210, partial [Chlorobiaceae bacterium]
ILYPQLYDRSLRFDFPKNQAELWAYCVPCSEYANGLGSIFSPAGIVDRENSNQISFAYPLTFWFKRISSFRLLLFTAFIDDSLTLAMSPCPLTLSACYWQIQLSLTGSPTVSCGYVSRLLHTG